jgi:N6-L-threonylcarbamoyladenine synthase
MSFSGLKTAVLLQMKSMTLLDIEKHKNSLCASFQKALFRHIITTAKRILASYPSKMVLISGGVSANKTLYHMMDQAIECPVLKPGPGLSTDNAIMIAWAGYCRYCIEGSDTLDFEVQSSLPLVSY